MPSARRALGFDRPLIVQYLDYLWDAVRLQFGTTITDGQTIGSIIVENGGATLTLTVAALIFALIVGLPLGPDRGPLPSASASRRRSRRCSEPIVCPSVIVVPNWKRTASHR